MAARASSESGSVGLPSTLYLPAETKVHFSPIASSAFENSTCSANTPIDPTWPDGVTQISVAATESQYAADADTLFTAATIGFDFAASRIAAKASGTPNTSPPGESTSRTIASTFGS